MGYFFKDQEGKEFNSTLSPHGDVVRVGQHDMSLADFCGMAEHVISGGFTDQWKDAVPQPVSEFLDHLYKRYRREGDKWIWEYSSEPMTPFDETEDKGGLD